MDLSLTISPDFALCSTAKRSRATPSRMPLLRLLCLLLPRPLARHFRDLVQPNLLSIRLFHSRERVQYFLHMHSIGVGGFRKFGCVDSEKD
jgi:hypothetical protein